MTFFDLVHLLDLFTHSLEFIEVLRVTGAVALNGTAALEDANVTLSLLKSLIMLIKATINTTFKALNLTFEFLNLGQERIDQISLVLTWLLLISGLKPSREVW